MDTAPDTTDQLATQMLQAINKRVCFFVGAGVSVGSNLPTFSELSYAVIQGATGGIIGEADASDVSRNLRPEVVLQAALEECGPEALTFLQLLEDCSPNPNHYFLAALIGTGCSVFTTNLDSGIETACARLGVRYRLFYTEEQFKELADRITREQTIPDGCIFKLHGHIESALGQDKFRSVTVALQQVGKGLSRTKAVVLAHFLKNLDFYFTGYSCMDEFSVFPILLSTDSRAAVHWFQYQPGPLTTPLRDADVLSQEIELETKKPPSAVRSWETINVNTFLLRRDKHVKIRGDSSEFVARALCPALGLSIPSTRISRAVTPPQPLERLNAHVRSLLAGRFFQLMFDSQKALQFYRKAEEYSSMVAETVAARRRIADVQALPSTAPSYSEAVATLSTCLETCDLDSTLKAFILADMANHLRRSNRLGEARKAAEEAVRILNEQVQQQSGVDSGLALSHARALNVLGLIYYGQRGQINFEKALLLCRESRGIREAYGDVEGVAESDNAIGLILYDLSEHAASGQERVELLQEAESSLQRAKDTRVRTGNFRGAFQQCRNLGLVYARLADVRGDSTQRIGTLKAARQCYLDGISYLNAMKPRPPEGEVLECHFRIGELSVRLADVSAARHHLITTVERRRQLGDWHNLARALEQLVLLHIGSIEGREYAREILDIYDGVCVDQTKLKMFRDRTIMRENADSMLGTVAKFYETCNDLDLAHRSSQLQQQLREFV